LKRDDGAGRAAEVMVAACMARLLRADKALAEKLIDQASPPIQSRVGAKVGALRPTVALA
ncbi:MAG: asparaginase, partial [Mesorhizobium sp.]